MIAGSYSFGISLRSFLKVSCTNSNVISLIFITVARSYRYDSWQLQFWDIIVIRLKSIMYQFLRGLFNFYHCSSQLQL